MLGVVAGRARPRDDGVAPCTQRHRSLPAAVRAWAIAANTVHLPKRRETRQVGGSWVAAVRARQTNRRRGTTVPVVEPGVHDWLRQVHGHPRAGPAVQLNARADAAEVGVDDERERHRLGRPQRRRLLSVLSVARARHSASRRPVRHGGRDQPVARSRRRCSLHDCHIEAHVRSKSTLATEHLLENTDGVLREGGGSEHPISDLSWRAACCLLFMLTVALLVGI